MTITPVHHFPLGGIFAVVLVMNLANAAPSPAWERLAPLPLSNGGSISGVLADTLIVAGGTHWRDDTKVWFDQIWTYDALHNTWREAGRLSAPLAYAVAGGDGRTFWFAGGSSGTTTHRSLWKIEAGFAPQLVAPLDHGIVYAAGSIIDSTLYAVGGTDDQAALERVGNIFLAIDLKTGAITRLADYPEAGLTTGTAAAVGDRLFVFGGARWDSVLKTVVNHATAHAYSVADKKWTALPRLRHAGRGFAAVALDDRHILVAGGYRNDEVEFVADAWVFDVRTGWKRSRGRAEGTTNAQRKEG